MKDIYIFIIMAGLFYYLDIKYVLVIFIGLYIITDYKNIKNKITKKLNLTTNSNKSKKSLKIEYNSKIESILNNLKKYKKNFQYLKGIYYWSNFIKTLNILENDKLQNYNQYFDKAFDYLKQSVNYFHSINVKIKERKLISGIQYNDFTSSKNTKKISLLSKDLYKEGYLLLYNLSLRLNKRWKENPNINNKPIIFDHPLPFNDKDTNFDFFI
jgi:hypothetical protein